MNWNDYEHNYYSLAKIKGKTDEYCIEQLKYAKILFDKKIPIIYSQEHLSKLVGYSLEYLYSASNSSEKFYRTFYIRKKNGKKRKIEEPLPSLKEIQRWILNEILEYVPESPYSKAYRKGISIKDNARFHRKQKKVLMMDLHDFFGTIHFGRVYSFFSNLGYRKPVAIMLANLCCHDGHLPQGAVTSPKLANLIARDMDYKIWNIVKKDDIRYTRYADDMTFSGDFSEGELIKSIENIVTGFGFKINDKKTKVRKNTQSQQVTGIVVNEKMQVSKKVRKMLRQNAYYVSKYGIDDHMNHIQEQRDYYLYHLIGTASYAHYINPSDEKIKGYLQVFIDELKRRDMARGGYIG